jgi:hypothetical protein
MWFCMSWFLCPGQRIICPLVDIVLAYLNDPKGLLGLISEAHMSWQNPAVAANLLARRREYDESVLVAVSATHERLRKHTINVCVCVSYLTLALTVLLV